MPSVRQRQERKQRKELARKAERAEQRKNKGIMKVLVSRFDARRFDAERKQEQWTINMSRLTLRQLALWRRDGSPGSETQDSSLLAPYLRM